MQPSLCLLFLLLLFENSTRTPDDTTTQPWILHHFPSSRVLPAAEYAWSLRQCLFLILRNSVSGPILLAQSMRGSSQEVRMVMSGDYSAPFFQNPRSRYVLTTFLAKWLTTPCTDSGIMISHSLSTLHSSIHLLSPLRVYGRSSSRH